MSRFVCNVAEIDPVTGGEVVIGTMTSEGSSGVGTYDYEDGTRIVVRPTELRLDESLPMVLLGRVRERVPRARASRSRRSRSRAAASSRGDPSEPPPDLAAVLRAALPGGGR